MNFTLHYKLLTGDFRTTYKDTEARFFVGTILVATFLITLDLRFHIVADLGKAFQLALFQVASIITTTGFVTDNFAKWPAFSQAILLVLMFIGGSAGSTGGAIKCVRIVLVLKRGYSELYRLIHPHAVTQVKLGGQTVPIDVMKSVLGFFVLYLLIAIVATLALCGLGLDMITSFAAMATTLGNVGPGLGLYHPATTFSQAPVAVKWLLSFCMLVGRLEIYTVLVLLVPEFWKK
jgi:trk system potassium uptake protein TrkH